MSKKETKNLVLRQLLCSNLKVIALLKISMVIKRKSRRLSSISCGFLFN
jgi:hypothetical protein